MYVCLGVPIKVKLCMNKCACVGIHKHACTQACVLWRAFKNETMHAQANAQGTPIHTCTHACVLRRAHTNAAMHAEVYMCT